VRADQWAGQFCSLCKRVAVCVQGAFATVAGGVHRPRCPRLEMVDEEGRGSTIDEDAERNGFDG
jgi:hypothetical protein